MNWQLLKSYEIVREMRLNIVFVLTLLCIVGHVVGAIMQNRGRARNDNIVQDVSIRSELTRDSADPRESSHMNPISRLSLIQSKKKGPAVAYELVEIVNVKNDKNITINKRFRMRAKLDDLTAEGIGLTKKEAKREAAKELLQKMNLSVSV